ncbi:hypothetical protein OFC03_28040, partial [Escherichia coli]|nr:hypothetical protein [Escherichia coli]
MPVPVTARSVSGARKLHTVTLSAASCMQALSRFAGSQYRWGGPESQIASMMNGASGDFMS